MPSSTTGKNILVTGGAGFIGSHLVDALAESNSVMVVDDFSVGSMGNLQRHRTANRVRIIEADVRNTDKMKEVARNVDIVFHLAVQCLRLSIGNPELVHEVNATGTLSMLLASRESGVKRFVYVSSSEAYGTAQHVPMNEGHPLQPTTPYGASKAAGELYTRSFYLTDGLPTIIVRPFNTYGPRAHSEGAYGEVIPRFVLRALKDLPPVIFGDGEQTRDFTYVEDTVRGIILASECDQLIGEAVNVGYGSEVSINELAQIIVGQLGKDRLQPEYQAPRPGDVRRHYCDITKAVKLLGFRPEVSIQKGIGKYLGWLQEQSIPLAKELDQQGERNW
jgi:UDP-glucose 4-epimerase